MKLAALLLVALGLAVAIVPMYTDCQSQGKSLTVSMGTMAPAGTAGATATPGPMGTMPTTAPAGTSGGMATPGPMGTTPSAVTTPMKCHWSGVAELTLAVPLILVGGSMAFSRRKETKRLQALLGFALGALVIMVPTVLIGVCASSAMVCNSVMRPTLVLAGILIMAISLVAAIMNERSVEASA